MPRKKSKSENYIGEDLLFCTECGEQLDEFCFKDNSLDVDAIKKNHENCKKIGKFKGDICSRLFIVSDNDVDEIILD
jgi:hypothetical protein